VSAGVAAVPTAPAAQRRGASHYLSVVAFGLLPLVLPGSLALYLLRHSSYSHGDFFDLHTLRVAAATSRTATRPTRSCTRGPRR
jgi:hypothetical protein